MRKNAEPENLATLATGLAPSRSTRGTLSEQQRKLDLIVRCGKRLTKSYRRNEIPEDYAATLAGIFSAYPDEVIEFVTSLETGIQRRCNFFPTVKELVDACNEHHAYLMRKHRMENFGRILGPPEPAGAPPEERPTLEELKAKYGPNWGIEQDKPKPKNVKPAPSWNEIAEFYQANPGRLTRLIERES